MTTPSQPRGYRLVRRAAQATAIVPDPVQAQVIAHTAGPLLVVGGPGTGKTTTMVEAIAARVADGVPGERILALTFGRKGAAALRERVELRMAETRRQAATTQPMVRTFHGYAFGLLRRAAVAAGSPAPRLLTAPEQDQVIREVLDARSAQDWPEDLRPALATRGFIEELRDLLLRAIERGISPARLGKIAADNGREDWAAAARFYQEYLQILALRDMAGHGQLAYDYAELVRAATGLLRDDPTLLAAERRRLSHVYLDELAETDPAQIELLHTIAGGGVPLVAFADPDAATFAFRGADPTIVADFPDRFTTAAGAPAPQITLITSYRAGPTLLAATRRVGARLRGPARHRQLEPAEGGGGAERLEVRTFATEAVEAAFIAGRLREAHILHGIPWSRMAVMVRSAVLARGVLHRAMVGAGIPTVTAAEDIPLHNMPAIATLLLALRIVMMPDQLDETSATALLHSPIGMADPFAERQLRQGLRAIAMAAGDQRPSGELLVEVLREPERLDGIDRPWAGPAKAVARVLSAGLRAVAVPDATAEDVLWAVWESTGLAERWAAASAAGGYRGASADRDLDAVVALFATAERFVDRLPGAGPLVFLDYLLGQDLPVDSIAPVAQRGEAVRILTAHAAKGLEFDLVAIAGVSEGSWPDLRLRGSVLGSEQLVDLLAGRQMEIVGRLSAMVDEERRLFYTAATRASRWLLATAVAAGDEAAGPSRFLTELAGAELDDEPGTGPSGAGSSSTGQAGTSPSGAGQSGQPTDAMPASTMPALVADLRGALLDPGTPENRRTAAAAMLARLAEAGVATADPDNWWGLPEISDDRPLVEPGEPVRVTPSAVVGLSRCSLRWLLERNGGSRATSAEQGIGNLVHEAAMLADAAGADRAELAAYVAERFDAIELSARWLAGRQHERAEAMLDKLVGWLAGNPRRLIGIEREFLVELADPDGPIQLTGRVDRLEQDEAGRLVVIDLKTGAAVPTEAEVAEHPQLAAYQAAVEAGAFTESDVSGGAALVQLGTPAAKAREQAQLPLTDAPDPGWATDLVRRTARTMAASTFTAVTNKTCRTCPVCTSCPVSAKGRQVVGGDQ